MALFDFLKRKKEAEKSREGRKPEKKVEKKSAEVYVAKEKDVQKKEIVAQKPVSKLKKNSKFSYEAVIKPHISEKATYLAEKNQYVFEILPSYNKNEIKKSVEGIYGVDVLSVNKVKTPPKKRRIGKTEGFKKGYAKAIVKIKEGQKIEIL